MVHILSGSVSFRKVPIPTQVLVFCGTERNRKNLLTDNILGVYSMLWYHMEINSFYREILYACKMDTIMYTYLLHLNQLAFNYVLSYVFLSISEYAVQNMNIQINIDLIRIFVDLIG